MDGDRPVERATDAPRGTLGGPWSRRNFLKATATVVGASAVGGLLEACASAAPTASAPPIASASAAAITPSAAASSAAHMSFWTWQKLDVATIQAAASAAGIGATIDPTVVPATEYDAKLLTAMQAGLGPDFFHGRTGLGYYKQYADANALLVLNDLIPELKTNFPASALDATTVGGKIVAVPTDVDYTQFIFNKQVVQDVVGASWPADGPASWEDFIAAAEIFKGKKKPFVLLGGKDSWTLGFNVAGLAATHLPDQFVADLIAGRAKFTDAPFVEVLQKLKQLTQYAQPGFQSGTYDDVINGVAKGTAGGLMMGTWVPTALKAVTSSIDLYQFVSPPNTTGGHQGAAYFYGGGWAVNASAKTKDAATALARYTASAAFGQLITDQQNIISPMAANTHPTVKDPFLARTLTLAQHATPQTWWQYSVFDAGNPGINTLLPPAAQGVITGQLTPEAAAQQIQEGIAAWYQPPA